MTPRCKLQVSLAFLIVVHACVLFAGFWAPYDPAAQNREQPFAPPTPIHFVDSRGHFHLRPFIYELHDTNGGQPADAQPVPVSASTPMRFFVRGDAYKMAGIIPGSLHLFGADDGQKVFLLGTDAYGRDQLSRFLFGGQISLLAGLLAAALSVSIGAAIGAISGYHGGWLDRIIMRGTELFQACPWLYLLFAVRAALPLHIPQWHVLLLLICVLGLLGWARPARLVRGVVLSAKERNFVTAARGFGAGDIYILREHVLPQTYSVLLTQLALLIPQYVLAEVTLTFLGLGVSEPFTSWGSLLSSLQQYSVVVSYWWMFLPAAILIPVFGAFYLAADALQEHLNATPL